MTYERKQKMRQRRPGPSMHEVLPWQPYTVYGKTEVRPGEKQEVTSFLTEMQISTLSTKYQTTKVKHGEPIYWTCLQGMGEKLFSEQSDPQSNSITRVSP